MAISNQENFSFQPAETINPLNKGLGAFNGSLDRAAIARAGWNLLREDLSLPAAVLYQSRLVHNLEWMRQFMAAYNVKLAPHGKTTMAPRLFKMQMDHGAWGITLATAQQTRAAYAHDIRRVLMANQLVGKQNMAVIAQLIADPGFEFYCLVDSAALVYQLERYFSARGLRLNVLIELGVDGGRAGVRSSAQLDETLNALQRCGNALALCGVEIYEGVLKDEPAIRQFLGHAVEVTRRLFDEGRFARSPALLSGAGSAWYDVVADVFSEADFKDSVEVVLRPGCYLTHDVGAYRDAQARIGASNSVARRMGSELLPALQVWAYVQSIPQATRAIIGMGKRDAAFDSGLPAPALHFRPGWAAPVAAASHWSVSKMMDQHAFLEIDAADNLCVGDMIGFDICHPCLTFDKWRTMTILDDVYNVVDVVETYF